MATDGNQRRTPRVPVELKVEYKRLNTFFADYTKNICKGGTFIRTKSPLDIGTEFVFKLCVPELGEPLAIRGQVRWVKRPGEPAPPGVGSDHEPGMGIRFMYQSAEERMRIESTVEKLMMANLGPALYARLISKEGA